MLSISHLVIIFIVALAVLGPEKLPMVARTMGRAMAELRRLTGDFRYQIESEMREIDRQAAVKQQEATIAAVRASGAVPTGQPVAPFETAEDTALGVSAVVSESTPPDAAATPSPNAPAEKPPAQPPPAEPSPADHKLSNAH